MMMMMMMMMKMTMMNCFCSMVDRRKTFSLISSRDHCQRSSPSWVSDTPRAGFEPAQSLSSDLLEWSCAVVITTTPRRHNIFYLNVLCIEYTLRVYILLHIKKYYFIHYFACFKTVESFQCILNQLHSKISVSQGTQPCKGWSFWG